MKPAPVVALTETGSPVTYFSGEVGLIDAARALPAPTLAGLLKGSAQFSNATLTKAVTKDLLTAVLGLASTPEIPTLNLVAKASVLVTVPVVPAVMLSPVPGSTLTSGIVTFSWAASDVPGTQYGLIVGTKGQGSHDVYISPALTGTSLTLSVPTTGATLYVGLTQGQRTMDV